MSADTVTTSTTAVAAPISSAGKLHGGTETGGTRLGLPRVSLPNLRAILDHGGGMTPADVSGICELALRKEEGASNSPRKTSIPAKTSTPAPVGSQAATTGKDGPAAGFEPDGGVGSPGAGVEANETTPQGLHNEQDAAHAAGNEAAEVQDTANRTAASRNGAGGRNGLTAEEHDQLMTQDQPAVTISFTTVSECKAVREWIRRGAYTLPAFEITSGQRTRDAR